MVVPSTPRCPRTSTAAFTSFRRDSRLRSWRGSSVFLTLATPLYTSSGPPLPATPGKHFSKQAGLTSVDVNVNIHLHYRSAHPISATGQRRGSCRPRPRYMLPIPRPPPLGGLWVPIPPPSTILDRWPRVLPGLRGSIPCVTGHSGSSGSDRPSH